MSEIRLNTQQGKWLQAGLMLDAVDDSGNSYCSGSIIPDTNVGGKVTTLSEVPDDQKATFIFS